MERSNSPSLFRYLFLPIGFCIFFSVMILTIWVLPLCASKVRKAIRAHDTAEDEFQQAKSLNNDRCRMGRTLFFGRGLCAITELNQVKTVYVHEQYYQILIIPILLRRDLYYINAAGKRNVLTVLPRSKKKSRSALTEIFELLLQYNPEIQIGQ